MAVTVLRRVGIVALGFALVAVAYARSGQKRRLGEIDFFGYKGIDIAPIRAALPFHEGEVFPPPEAKSSGNMIRLIRERVHQLTGHDPTDVALMGCDVHQNAIVFIGLMGESYRAPVLNPAPSGSVRWPNAANGLQDKMDGAWERAVMSGHATEDDSAGYTLTNDPKARAAELALRDFALQHEEILFDVLASSLDADQRATAAEMIGYGRQSDRQIAALVHASLDPDSGVRNNATRALEVLATAKPELAREIPLAPYVQMIQSGSWLDHNKGSLVLVALTESRDPKILAALRAEALDSLLEMGRWRSPGHAEAALTVLGRMAGMEEDALQKLVDKGDAATILAKFET